LVQILERECWQWRIFGLLKWSCGSRVLTPVNSEQSLHHILLKKHLRAITGELYHDANAETDVINGTRELAQTFSHVNSSNTGKAV